MLTATSWLGRAALAAVLVVALTMVGVRPVVATVASIDPATATVRPGEGASATVTVRGEGVNCLRVSVTPEEPTVRASVAKSCDSRNWTTRLNVTTTDATPPGIYDVEVADPGTSAWFRLEVDPEAPPPPPPPPPPTTTAPPPPPTTTTAPAPTTVPAVTQPPPTATSEPPPPTTAGPPPPPEQAFTAVDTLVAAGIAEEGLFLPFLDSAYRNCLPLAAVCQGADEGLWLVPARSAQVRWGEQTAPPSPPLTPLPRAVPPLKPVGAPPAQPAEVTYLLSVLDLTAASSSQVKSLPRGIDASGALVAPAGDLPPMKAALVGAETPEGGRAPVLPVPFAKPYRRTSAGLTEASPALVVAVAEQAHLLYGLRPDPAWGLNVDFVPLLGTDRVPYLVRGAVGPPGLFVPLPPGLDLPAPPASPAGTATDEGPDRFPQILILLNVTLATVLIAGGILSWRQKWRSA